MIRSNRGIVLIGTYLILSLFLVYSNVLTMQGLSQQQAANQTRATYQAMNLAQAATVQLQENLHTYLTTVVYQQVYQGNAIRALTWLDNLDTYDSSGSSTEVPGWTGATSPHTPGNPLCITTLPTVESIACVPRGQDAQAPRAWIQSVSVRPGDEGNLLAPRLVTIRAQSQTAGRTKTVDSTYIIELGMSNIFENAYFVNNYGWFDLQGNANIIINGEVRANGDLDFTGNRGDMYVQGDVYASENPELNNPTTGLPSTGTITGDPNQISSESSYHSWKAHSARYWNDANRARPTEDLVFGGQPAINGDSMNPYGWDSTPVDQTMNQRQPTQAIPYLGNLDLYKQVARDEGGTLRYYDASAGGWQTISAVSANSDPVVLVGTSSNPIRLDGPVVIEGDVIIKGVVDGRGTIYGGRNVHIVGNVKYRNPTTWESLDREQRTGQVRRHDGGSVGYVSDAGVYTVP